MVATTQSKFQRKAQQFPGIKAAARALKVDRITLWRALTGRTSGKNRLREGYALWLSTHAASITRPQSAATPSVRRSRAAGKN